MIIPRLLQKKFFSVVHFVMHILPIKSHVVLVVPEILHFSTLPNLQTNTAIILIFSLFLFHLPPVLLLLNSRGFSAASEKHFNVAVEKKHFHPG